MTLPLGHGTGSTLASCGLQCVDGGALEGDCDDVRKGASVLQIRGSGAGDGHAPKVWL